MATYTKTFLIVPSYIPYKGTIYYTSYTKPYVNGSYGNPVAYVKPTVTSGSSVVYIGAPGTGGVGTITHVGSGLDRAVLRSNFSATSNYASSSESAVVQVEKANTTTTASLGATTINVGQTTTLNSTVKSNANNETVTTNVSGSNTSSNTGVATISGRTITGKAPGTSTIIAKYGGSTYYNASQSTGLTITVKANSASITKPSNYTKTYGDANFTVNVTKTGCNLSFTVSGSSVSIASSTTSSVTLKINSAGTSTINITSTPTSGYSGNPTSSFTVTVNKKSTTTTASLTTPLQVGQTTTLSSTVKSGSTTITSNVSGSNTSSNTAVATISGVTVTAIKAGTSTITAKYNGSTNYSSSSGSVTLTVNQANTTSHIMNSGLSSEYTSITINYGSTLQLGALVLNSNNGGTVSSSTTGVSWSVGNSNIITCSGGLVTSKGAGTTTLTITFGGTTNYYNSSSKTINVTVNKANTTTTASLSSTSIRVGQTTTLNSTIKSNVTGGTVTTNVSGSNTSSNTAVATISGRTVTGIKAGTSSITAIYGGNTNYNGSSGAVTITVSNANTTSHIMNSGLSSEYTSITINYGSTLQLGALVLNAHTGGTISTSTTGVSWSVGNSTYISCNNGLITPKAAGTTTLTITFGGTTNYYNSSSKTINVTVSKAGTTTTASLSPTSIQVGATSTLSSTVTSNVTGGTVTTNVSGSNTSSNTAVATISGRTVTGVKPGTSSITAKYGGSTNYGSSSGSATITVVKANTETGISCTTSIYYGQTVSLSTYTKSSVTGNKIGYYAVSSNNTNIVSIGSTGTYGLYNVTGNGVGSARVTANYPGDDYYNASSKYVDITVSKANTTTTASLSSTSIRVGQTTTLNSTVKSNITGGTVTTNVSGSNTSSNTAVATISGRTVTGVRAGTSSITAIYGGSTNYNSSSGAVTITVSNANTTSHIMNSGLSSEYTSSITINYGSSVQLGALVLNAHTGATISTSTSGVSWSVGNSNIITCSGGLVTSKAAGTTTLTITFGGWTNYYNSSSKTINVTVSKANTTTSASLSPTSIQVGQTSTLSSTVTSNVTGGTVTTNVSGSNTSSNTAVATISGRTVTGIKPGTSTITAYYGGSSNYNSSSGAATITVVKANTDTKVFCTTSIYYGQVVSLSTYTKSSVTGSIIGYYTASSNNTNIVYVGWPGTPGTYNISGQGVGSARVTVNYPGNDYYNSSSNYVDITVSKANTTTTASLSATTIRVGGTTTLNSTVKSNVTGSTITSNVSGSNTSSNTAVATISGRTVTGIKAGTSSITAKYTGSGNYNASQSAVTITVINDNTTTTIKNSSGTEISSLSIALFNSHQLRFTVTANTTGKAISGASVTWSSSNTGVVTVASNGNLYAAGAGTATITANYGGSTNYYNSSSDSITVTVPKALPSLTLNISRSNSWYGQSAPTLSISADYGSTNITKSLSSFTWTSSTPSTISVNSSGALSLVTPSRSTTPVQITANYGGSNNYYSTSTYVKTYYYPADTTTNLSASATSVYYGQSAPSLTLSVTSAYVGTVTTSKTGVSWSSSNSGVLSVNSSGTLSLVGFGNATITASFGQTTYYNSSSKSVTIYYYKANTNSHIMNSGLTSEYTSSISIAYNQTISLGSLVLNSHTGGTVSTSNSNVTWSVGNSNYISCNNGTLFGKSPGSSSLTITYPSNTNYNSSSKTVQVNVSKDNTTTDIRNSGNSSISSINIPYGSSSTIKVLVNSNYSSTVTTSIGSLSWSIGNTNIATFSNGTISAVNVGSTTLNAYYPGNTFFNSSSDSLSVKIIAANTTVHIRDANNNQISNGLSVYYGGSINVKILVLNAHTGTTVTTNVNNINWSTSPTGFASVSRPSAANILLYGDKAGSTELWATYPSSTNYNTSNAYVPVTVKKAPVTVTISVSPTTLYYGNSAPTFTVKITSDISGAVVSTNASDVSWSTSNSDCITVSNGTVVFAYPGNPSSARISAYYGGSSNYLSNTSNTVTINYYKASTVTHITSNNSQISSISLTYEGTITVAPLVIEQTNGTNIATQVGSVSWMIGDTSIISRSGGTITAKKAGTTTLKSTFAETDYYFNSSKTINVTVSQAGTTTVITASSTNVYYGQAAPTFTVTVKSTTTNKNITTSLSGVTWTSEFASRIAVGASTGIATLGTPGGYTNVTATFNEVKNYYNASTSNTIKINYLKADTTTNLSASTTIVYYGQSAPTLTVSATSAYVGTVTTAKTDFTWSSSNTNVISVNSSGVLSLVNPGNPNSSTITATFPKNSPHTTNYNSSNKTVTIQYYKAPTFISLTGFENGLKVQYGTQMKLPYVVVSNITKEVISTNPTHGTWTVDDDSIVSVNNVGVITAKKIGSTTVHLNYNETSYYYGSSTTINIEVVKANTTVYIKNNGTIIDSTYTTTSDYPSIDFDVLVQSTVVNNYNMINTFVEITRNENDVSWTSSNTYVLASLMDINDPGKMQIKKAGISTLTVEYPGNENYNSSSKSITVIIDPVSGSERKIANWDYIYTLCKLGNSYLLDGILSTYLCPTKQQINHWQLNTRPNVLWFNGLSGYADNELVPENVLSYNNIIVEESFTPRVSVRVASVTGTTSGWEYLDPDDFITFARVLDSRYGVFPTSSNNNDVFDYLNTYLFSDLSKNNVNYSMNNNVSNPVTGNNCGTLIYCVGVPRTVSGFDKLRFGDYHALINTGWITESINVFAQQNTQNQIIGQKVIDFTKSEYNDRIVHYENIYPLMNQDIPDTFKRYTFYVTVISQLNYTNGVKFKTIDVSLSITSPFENSPSYGN